MRMLLSVLWWINTLPWQMSAKAALPFFFGIIKAEVPKFWLPCWTKPSGHRDISVEGTKYSRRRWLRIFKRFFGAPEETSSRTSIKGLASGYYWSDKGYIVKPTTMSLENATEITGHTDDGRGSLSLEDGRWRAKVILPYLEIEPENSNRLYL